MPWAVMLSDRHEAVSSEGPGRRLQVGFEPGEQ
jgi:hypothetical protein